MITIFHGDNQVQSRQAFHQFLATLKNSEIFRIDTKSIDLNQINNFLHRGSLFPGAKVICFNNFFSISKTNFDKIIKLISIDSCDVIIWQDKQLTATQLKIFPTAKIVLCKADNQIFSCLNALQPHNLSRFSQLYDKVVSKDLFDLFLYLLKANLRKQLTAHSKFGSDLVKKIYLQILELEFQYKTGQLPLPKELALIRVLTPLLR